MRTDTFTITVVVKTDETVTRETRKVLLERDMVALERHLSAKLTAAYYSFAAVDSEVV